MSACEGRDHGHVYGPVSTGHERCIDCGHDPNVDDWADALRSVGSTLTEWCLSRGLRPPEPDGWPARFHLFGRNR